MPAPNSLEARRAKAGIATVPREPTAVILSVRLDNDAFEASVTVPLSKAADFNDYVARWLKLTEAALKHGIEEMNATIAETDYA